MASGDALENVDWQSHSRNYTWLKLEFTELEEIILIIVLLCRDIVHDNTTGVFLYMFAFAYYEKDGYGLC